MTFAAAEERALPMPVLAHHFRLSSRTAEVRSGNHVAVAAQDLGTWRDGSWLSAPLRPDDSGISSERLLQACCKIGLLPREAAILVGRAAEMTVRGSAPID